MTSKNLCFKLMIEDLKRRVWTIALTILTMVFGLVVPAAIRSSSYLDQLSWRKEEYERVRAAKNLVNLLGINGAVITLLLILAVVWAVSGFKYLHNSRQVDFYHSIPVRRHQLFLSSYLNGILVPAVVYLVSQIIAAALVLRTGVGAEMVGTLPWTMFLVNMVYYSMMYTVTVIAMMLTGNLIVALLGTGVFLSYGPAVVYLTEGYKQVWFRTFYETEAQMWLMRRNICYSSPFANYMFALGDFSEGALGVRRVIGAAAVTAFMAVFAYGLYRIRPSEAAGRAMAFKKTKSPIKILIALPVSVVFGIFFYGLRSTLTWGIFGTVCGALITCCLMEIIYHFDFRKLFANWIHLAGCCGVSILLFLAGMYDWYGYDSYLPKATDIKSAAVLIGYTEGWVTYGEPKENTDYRGRKSYGWNYARDTEYQFGHMELTDIYPVMELAEKGIAAAQSNDPGAFWEVTQNWQESQRYVIQFRLNNGRVVNRQYWIPIDEEAAALRASIHDSKEYKRGVYPLLNQLPQDTSSVYFQQYNQVTPLTLSTDDRNHLLALYQKELEELTMEDRENSLPIGTIQFRTKELDQAIAYNRELDYGYEELEGRCYYPVYPSFIRTIEALEAAGVKPVLLEEAFIDSIMVTYSWKIGREGYTEPWEGDNIVIYDGKYDIQTLAPALVFYDYYNMNEFYDRDYAANIDVTVKFVPGVFSSDKRTNNGRFYIDLNRLSKEEADRLMLYGKSYD